MYMCMNFRRADCPEIHQTDDKGVFCTSLTKEYQHAARAFSLTNIQLYDIAYAAIDHIFDEDSKAHLRLRFEEFARQHELEQFADGVQRDTSV